MEAVFIQPGEFNYHWSAKTDIIYLALCGILPIIVVGDKEFVMETKAKPGAKAIGRRELENNEGYELKEPQSPYL